MKILNSLIFLSVVGLNLILSWSPGKAKEPDEAHKAWAKPIKKTGLSNLHKVSENLYRGAQPEEEGYAELAKLGIKTIVCLRTDDEDSKHLGDLPIRCVHIPMKTWSPSDEQVVEFLKVATDKKRLPVFVHCKHGSDRTGVMCAMYRVVVEGWSNQAAAEEMVKGEFGFHPLWTNLVKFVQKIDADALRKKAGLKKATAGDKGTAEK
jgi:tyrosine-protein phosphatase SIW14